MKRKLLILSVLAICIATLAAGTLAYFTSEGNVINLSPLHQSVKKRARILVKMPIDKYGFTSKSR